MFTTKLNSFQKAFLSCTPLLTAICHNLTRMHSSLPSSPTLGKHQRFLTRYPAKPSSQLFPRKDWTRDVNNTPQYTTAQASFVGRISFDGHQKERYIHGVGLGEEMEQGEGITVAGGVGENSSDLFTWICQLVQWIQGLFALEHPTSALVPGEKHKEGASY